ncbi:MAG: hypothetical protein SFZ02_18460 [bacterium]|nr:hypothetical protein [bacterium]
MIFINIAILIIFPLAGIFEIILGIRTLKRRRFVIRRWHLSWKPKIKLYEGVPAIIFGVALLGLGIPNVVAFTISYFEEPTFINIISDMYPIIFYSMVCVLPLVLIAETIYWTQNKN